ncbi:MAG: AAA family ATPase, partial [Proteobacteria bacterium]|nr:AAA family ATPase [Pseudomonadota bacterium]
TYSVRQLGKSFENTLEVNFEEEPEIRSFFKQSLNVSDICEKLAAYYNIAIVPGKSLLFFDEIQACPDCLRSLRFFYEKMPDLHVVAAGSLLEFALSEILSFGVGRISSIFMYPMTFAEFLIAVDEEGLLDILQHGKFSSPVDPVFHERAFEKLKTYLAIGGMPAVVESYRTERSLQECMLLLDELLTNIRDDFSKYKRKTPVSVLLETFNSIAYQTGRKFKYANVSKDESFYNTKKSLDLLLKASLAFKIHHTSARGVPLGAQMNQRKFKVIIFDCGICNRILGLELSEHLLKSHIDLVNKGSLAELFVGLELTANTSPRLKPQLFYWHREAKNSNAEVDYVVQRNEAIYPVEVKSGRKGSMQSMNIFLSERNLNMGLRISQENFGGYQKIHTVPLYAASQITNLDMPL